MYVSMAEIQIKEEEEAMHRPFTKVLSIYTCFVKWLDYIPSLPVSRAGGIIFYKLSKLLLLRALDRHFFFSRALHSLLVFPRFITPCPMGGLWRSIVKLFCVLFEVNWRHFVPLQGKVNIPSNRVEQLYEAMLPNLPQYVVSLVPRQPVILRYSLTNDQHSILSFSNWTIH